MKKHFNPEETTLFQSCGYDLVKTFETVDDYYTLKKLVKSEILEKKLKITAKEAIEHIRYGIPDCEFAIFTIKKDLTDIDSLVFSKNQVKEVYDDLLKHRLKNHYTRPIYLEQPMDALMSVFWYLEHDYSRSLSFVAKFINRVNAKASINKKVDRIDSILVYPNHCDSGSVGNKTICQMLKANLTLEDLSFE
ncbi:MAG: hypothetical protein KBD14_01590 [Candidatus Pacebacteria bacterium]|nr:hypothetical protein [Candidatus Paceibacterota bacterium]